MFKTILRSQGNARDFACPEPTISSMHVNKDGSDLSPSRGLFDRQHFIMLTGTFAVDV